MEITWKEVFRLLDDMLELNASEIADYLHVSRSTITRLSNGTTKSTRLKDDEIYDALLNTSNNKSPVFGKDPRDLLGILKELIEKAGLSEATESLYSNDYETFVKGLLKLARKNEPERPAKRLSEDESTDNIQAFENPKADTASAVISYSNDCEICLCCSNWDGNFQNAIKSVSGTYGKCLLLSKDVLSADKCNEFAPKYGHIGMYECHKKQQNFKNLLKFS